MNIVILTSDFLPNVGGMATHAHELSKALATLGNDVHLVHPVYGQGLDFVEQFDGIVVHRLFISRTTPRIKHLSYITKTRRYLLELKRHHAIDLIHWHDLTPNCWTTRTVRGSFPLVWTNHTSNYLEYVESKRGRWKIKAFLSHPDAIISPSKELNEKSIHTGLDADRLFYIPNGVDATKFSPTIDPGDIAERYGLDRSLPIVICPRRLEPKNGVEFFIRAIPLVREKKTAAQFLIVGGGFPNERARFEAFLDEAKQRAGVVFTDNVPNTAMPCFYNISQIGVLPSLMEATSISGLEAMACGLPLIGTTVGGIPEIIEHERNGILTEPRRHDNIAAAILRLLDDPPLRERLGAAARARVEKEFSWSVIAKKTLDVYSKVLAMRGRA